MFLSRCKLSPRPPIVGLTYILILSSHISLRLPNVLSFRFPFKNPVQISLLPHTCLMHWKSRAAYLIFWTKSGEVHKRWSSSITKFSPVSCLPLRHKHLLPPSPPPITTTTTTTTTTTNAGATTMTQQLCFGPQTPQFSFLRLHSLMPIVFHPNVRSSLLAHLVTASTHLSFGFCTGRGTFTLPYTANIFHITSFF